MNYEQILIRLGIDAKAVQVGLGRVTSFVKGWATNLIHDLKHHMIGQLAGIYVFERLFESIKEKALFFARFSKETGLTTNAVQGIQQTLGTVGEGFEGISKPLLRFSALLGQAKVGSLEAREKLIMWGIAARDQNFNTLNLMEGLKRLAGQFDKVEDHEKRAAMMMAIFGKGYQLLMPVLEQGARRVADLDKGNFFTKLSPHAIETFAELFKTGKQAGAVALSFLGNLADISLTPLVNGLELVGRGTEKVRKSIGTMFSGTHDHANAEELLKQHAHETNEEFLDRIKLMEQVNDQHKLENQLVDRNKLTVAQLADRAREILGDRHPRGLKAIHAITPAMASALRISNLEDSAQAAAAGGRFDMADQFQSRADEMRKYNLSLKSTERDPMLEVKQKLEEINLALTQSGIKIKEIEPQNH